MGDFLGACITGCTSLVFARESANAHELIWELLYQVISGLMDLTAAGTVAGLVAATVVETGAGCGSFVQGCMTVMAQFIFMTASFSLERRPRMAGPGVSVTDQYECTQWGQAPGWPDCQVMGPWSAPYRGIWDLL